MGCCASVDNQEKTIEQKNTVNQDNNNETKLDPITYAVVKKSSSNSETNKSPNTLNSVSTPGKDNNPPNANTKNQNPSSGANNSKASFNTQILGPKGNEINKNVKSSKSKYETSSSSGTGGVRVGPDIFVTLRKDSIFDHYKIGRTLGEGAYGKVFHVLQKGTGNERAMKAIKKKAIIREDEEKLFAEVSILKGLDHPNIVKLYEMYQDDNHYYLITEYCYGGELFDKIQKLHSFTEKMAADYMRQILSAVVYCHENKIVHRDLKPENLLLDSKRNDANIKVIDFGTSKKFQEGEKLTQKFGTAYYIAPEILISKFYNEKCDVWSCGVILYILLCGYPPFGGANDHEIIRRVRIGEYRFDEEDWGKISDDAKNLIRKMLTKDPNSRISAKEALADPWLQHSAPSRVVNNKFMQNMAHFYSKNKLRNSIMTYIAVHIAGQNEKEDLLRAFEQLDQDQDGIITKDELIEGYATVYGDKKKALAMVGEIWDGLDINNNGAINFTEFVVAAMNREKLLSREKIEQAFQLFDIDGDGFVTKAELKNVMGGIELDDEELKNLVNDADTNLDGKISKQEFLDLLMKNFDQH